MLPEAVRKEQSGWRERLYVRALTAAGEFPKLPKRQREVWNIIEERRELPLQELLELAQTTSATVRHLEDKGLVAIAAEISERDPYAREHILPTTPLELNLQQVRALVKIKEAMGSTHLAESPGAHPLKRLSAAWGDGEREDGSVFAGAGACIGTGEGWNCAGTGDFADAADGGAVQGAVQFRAPTNAGRGVAQPSLGGGTAR